MEIGAIVVLIMLLFAERVYRRAEPRFSNAWDCLQRGDTAALETVEEAMAVTLREMVAAGRHVQNSQAGSESHTVRQLLATLIVVLAFWVHRVRRYLIDVLIFWAAVRAVVHVQPLPAERFKYVTLWRLARLDAVLLKLLPRAWRVQAHVRWLCYLLSLLPSLFASLDQLPAGASRQHVEGAVDDLDTLGQEVLALARRLRLSLVMAWGLPLPDASQAARQA